MVSILSAVPPVDWLLPYPQYGFIICTIHQSCYTLTNYQEHLYRKHQVTGRFRTELVDWISSYNLVNPVELPSNGCARFPELPVFQGWQCRATGCSYITRSQTERYQHHSSQHKLNSKKKQEEANCDEVVQVQILFAKSREYLIIDPTLPLQCNITSTSRPTTPTTTIEHFNTPNDVTDSWSTLSQRFHNVLEKKKEKYHRIEEAEHTAELTPWLRRSRFHEHVSGLDHQLHPFSGSYAIPRTEDDDPILYHLSQSINRILRQTMDQIQHLHHTDAMMLNSFQTNTISQDPFQYLQETSSITIYIRTFTNMICYFYRVADGYFEREMFQSTETQTNARKQVDDLIQQRVQLNLTIEDDPEEVLKQLEKEIDQATLQLCVTLIQHLTPTSPFHNAIISFCAVVCWSMTEQSWLAENDCATIFSRLIYCIQVIILGHGLALVEQKEYLNISDAIESLSRTWLVNNSKGPTGTLLGLRLYAMAVGRSSVTAAQIRWNQDGKTLHYQNISYHLDYLAQEINFCLEHAQEIFQRDLCFRLPDIPVYPVHELHDNWDARRPGLSFIDDPRNEAILEGGNEWLLQQIYQNSELSEMIFKPPSSVTHAPQIRSTFAQQYERSNQRFLEYIFPVCHKGSGQAGRKKEIGSLRCQNVIHDRRNLFIHDGYLCFLLTYHKSLSRFHASRYPVRFLLPKLGTLLVQYLVIVQPLRIWLSAEVQIPPRVSEYLWSDSNGIWNEQKITRIMKTMSKQAVGETVHIQAWRQIAVAIALKKFNGQKYQGDFDVPGDEEAENSGHLPVSNQAASQGLPDVFHHQAAHSVARGNLSYGGTVNFNAGLTDAGLQEYLIASQMWHQLCQPRLPSSTGVIGHRRHASTSLNPPLIKRVVITQQPQRHRRRWTLLEAERALNQVYPMEAAPRFRSDNQKSMIDNIVNGVSEIIAVLATGEGKSLAFLLPSCLHRAATTVVIIPLIALRQDMTRRCRIAGLEYSVWKSNGDLQEYLGTPLLFISMEAAVRQRFRGFLGQLDAAQGLDRIVIDESHLAITASHYRPKMALIKHLRQFRCQVICLTATLPPLMLSQFQQRFLFYQPAIIRSTTFRSDIFYKIQRPSRPRDLLEYLEAGIQRGLQYLEAEAAARVIIYTGTRATADELSSRLQCLVYYSDSAEEAEKAKVAERWRQGEHRVIVATSAFGMGIDYPAVRAVIHFGAPSDMISFAQEVGRLGRDGQGGTSRIILPYQVPSSTSVANSTPYPDSDSSPDWSHLPLPEQAREVYLGENRCLNAVLSRFLDGRESMQYCQAVEPERRCSRCEVLGLVDALNPLDPTRYWDPAPIIHSQRATMAGEEAVEEEEEKEESLSEESLHMTGPSRLRQHLRDEEYGRDRYIQRLHSLQGRCMICTLLRSGVGEMHLFSQCREVLKWRFFTAKRKIQDQQQSRGGWLKKYTACFRCGNPQEVCILGEEGAPSQGECEFRDLVFPTAWALFHMQRERRWGQSLQEITGCSWIGESETDWMEWCGGEVEVYGMRSCEAVRMTDWVMGQILDPSLVSGG